MSSLAQSRKSVQGGTGLLGLSLVRPMLAEAPKDEKGVISESRGEAKTVLSDAGAQPPVDPKKPEDPKVRLDLIEALHLESQYEKRMDTIMDMLGCGAWEEGALLPTCKQVLKSLTTDQLRIASKYREPFFLVVPKTSFRSKLLALNHAIILAKNRSIEALRGEHVSEMAAYRKSIIQKWEGAIFIGVAGDMSDKCDQGSKQIQGWQARIMEASRYVDIDAMGDDPSTSFKKRILVQRGKRGPGEFGMDRHLCAMYMLELLFEGELIDKTDTIICDDEMESFSPGVPTVYNGYNRHIMFGVMHAYRAKHEIQLRCSVGSDVNP